MNTEPPTHGQLQRGLILKEQGRYREAEDYFMEVLSADPRNAAALHQLAGCQLQQTAREKQALETIDRAIGLEPEDAYHHSLRSYILCALKRPPEALKASQQAIALDPSCGFAFIAKASVHLHLEQWAEAEKAARQALALDADNSVAANQLAHALRLQNKMPENAEQIRGMLGRDPENACTHANAGWTAMQRGDRKTAERHFLESLRLDPELEGARQGLLESFKARSPIYRSYLAYCFFMQRLSHGARWGVILGLYLTVRFSRIIFTGGAKPVYLGIVAIYFLMVLWVHVARGVGNFFLLLDRFARHALRPREKLEACGVGGGVVLGIALILTGFMFKGMGTAVLGVSLLGAAFPWAYTFTNESKIGSWMFGAFATFVVGTGVVVFFTGLFHRPFPATLTAPALSVSLILVIVTTWLANIRALHR
ncbi:MAG: tetratricopeptide repeat protein [Verrucomicrobia bacterium]|nr:tetratricopeptide repeat protein [Verrucomicrobiota bacterium]